VHRRQNHVDFVKIESHLRFSVGVDAELYITYRQRQQKKLDQVKISRKPLVHKHLRRRGPLVFSLST